MEDRAEAYRITLVATVHDMWSMSYRFEVVNTGEEAITVDRVLGEAIGSEDQLHSLYALFERFESALGEFYATNRISGGVVAE
jgi:hypothetical protein